MLASYMVELKNESLKTLDWLPKPVPGSRLITRLLKLEQVWPLVYLRDETLYVPNQESLL